MCGRYYRTADKSALQDVFKAVATGAAATYAPAYNISPHSIQLIVRQARDRATREIVPMRWGLVGHRTKGPGSTITPHIARADSLERSPLWSEPFHKRRCIIPANGYFEWLQPQGVPYCITLKYSEVFAFAGLWDAWKDPSNGEWTQSFAIITTHGNEILADFNDNYNDEEDPRMPVILQPDDYDYWLSRDEVNQPRRDLLVPYDAHRMSAWPANPKVGNIKNQGPDLLHP